MSVMLESPHILPYPPSVLNEEEGEGREVLDQPHMSYWRSVLDRLQGGLVEWEVFLNSYEGPLLSHPAAWAVTSELKQTLLHLAVVFDKENVVAALAISSEQKVRRDRFGHTPLDTARHLHRIGLISLLSTEETIPFWEQPNVAFPDLDRIDKTPSLEYLSHPIFENVDVMKEVLIRTQKAKLEDAIPTEKIWMGIYFDAEIQKQQTPAVSIRYIDEEVGFGAFAAQRIPPCAFVGEYTGVVVERKPRRLKHKYYCVRYPVWQMGKRKFLIDAEKKGNFTRFINHSNKPTLSLQSVYWKGMPRMIFVTTQEVSEGSQLTFDYGDIFWKECSQVPRPFD